MSVRGLLKACFSLRPPRHCSVTLATLPISLTCLIVSYTTRTALSPAIYLTSVSHCWEVGSVRTGFLHVHCFVHRGNNRDSKCLVNVCCINELTLM